MIDLMQNAVIGPYIRRGIEQGIHRGIRMALSRQLTTKFGPLPDHVSVQLDDATEDELLGCAERVLTACTLDEVLLPARIQAIDRGVREGARQTLSRLLTMKFKGLPDRAVEWLDRATKDELLDRCVRVLDADTIDEVIG